MTAGQIASLPFWALAAFFLLSTIACPCIRRPGETNVDLFRQSLTSMILTGVFAAVGAFVSHL